MRERPIIFNTEMVKAILEGRKTVTRRPIKNIPIDDYDKNDESYGPWSSDEYGDYHKTSDFCPIAQIGDRLYVRETFCDSCDDFPCFRCGFDICNVESIVKGTIQDNSVPFLGWKPSIHMLKKYARIWLEVTDIRVTKVKYCTERQCYDEGFIRIHKLKESNGYPGFEHTGDYISPKEQFEKTWNSIYKNWDDNPWVWVIEFKVVDNNGK